MVVGGVGRVFEEGFVQALGDTDNFRVVEVVDIEVVVFAVELEERVP